ncbi:MAG: PDZ domain-containing protein [Lautropia sp.]|nr:PDZ domain-containing protein [Lautropia sp.]
MESIHYSILPLDPGAHLFEVNVWVQSPDPAGQRLSLPTWIPGSYLIREFARHLDSVEAEARVAPPVGHVSGTTHEFHRPRSSAARTSAHAPGTIIGIRKINKNTWLCDPLPDARQSLLVRYQAYAWDLSVRAAHLDESHGFFNGSSVFLRVCGQEDLPCSVDILPPAGHAFEHWRVATTLPRHEAMPGSAHAGTARARRADGAARGATTQPGPGAGKGRRSTGKAGSVAATPAASSRRGAAVPEAHEAGSFGRYRASNYDELIDHPVEMGDFLFTHFDTGGCRHEIAITGRVEVDLDRLVRDLKPICQTQISFFEPKTHRAPVDRYLFTTMAVGDGYGGLEHRASTALICSRNDLPWPGMEGMPAGYQTFLGLASHEYFHTWNVKRIKPACFDPYDLDQEVFTELLWVFEGFTSYYDDLMLVRAGVIDESAYLKLMEQNIRRVAGMPGHSLLSVAESSQDAWIKYYRPDENTVNAVSSYYVKGALVALCLDLTIRAKTQSKRSLDDVMRLMWARYGRDFYESQHVGRGVEEGGMPALIREATGLNLSRQIRAWAHGTDELPLAACLKPFGVKLVVNNAAESGGAWLGARTVLKEGALTLASTARGGPASNAGLSAGDTLVAIDGLRATDAGLKALLSRRSPGDEIQVVAFRRDELRTATVRLGQTPGEHSLSTVAGSNAARAAWLGRVKPTRRQR